MIVVVVVVMFLVLCLLALEGLPGIDREWLRPWGFRFTWYRDVPQWKRHYLWALAIGPREYRRRAD